MKIFVLKSNSQAPPHLNLTRKKITLYTILERRHATPMFFYSPRPEVFVYLGLDNSITNFSLGYR